MQIGARRGSVSRKPRGRSSDQRAVDARPQSDGRFRAAEEHARVGFDIADAPDRAVDGAVARAVRAVDVELDAGCSSRTDVSTDVARVMRIAAACASAPASAHTGTSRRRRPAFCRVEAEHADHPERRRARVRDAHGGRRLERGRRPASTSQARSPHRRVKRVDERRRAPQARRARRRRVSVTRRARARVDGPARVEVPVHRRGVRAACPTTRSATTTRSPCSASTWRRCSTGA